MGRRHFFILAVLLWTTVGVGCGRSGMAPRMPDGRKIAVFVVMDKGITPDMQADRVDQINQLTRWMEDDLIDVLGNMGYAAARVGGAAAEPGPGRYVLRVTLTNYHAGSKAARMFVGFGAGSARIDTQYALVGAQGKVLLTGDTSVASGRDWTNAARKVNLQTADAATEGIGADLR